MLYLTNILTYFWYFYSKLLFLEFLIYNFPKCLFITLLCISDSSCIAPVGGQLVKPGDHSMQDQNQKLSERNVSLLFYSIRMNFPTGLHFCLGINYGSIVIHFWQLLIRCHQWWLITRWVIGWQLSVAEISKLETND